MNKCNKCNMNNVTNFAMLSITTIMHKYMLRFMNIFKNFYIMSFCFLNFFRMYSALVRLVQPSQKMCLSILMKHALIHLTMLFQLCLLHILLLYTISHFFSPNPFFFFFSIFSFYELMLYFFFHWWRILRFYRIMDINIYN